LSISTGTLAQAKEFIFGFVVPYDTLGSITDATGFTRFDIGASYRDWLVEYQVVNSTSSVTWNPSWGTQTPYAWVLLSFKGM
jgi:hypothetical protein